MSFAKVIATSARKKVKKYKIAEIIYLTGVTKNFLQRNVDKNNKN